MNIAIIGDLFVRASLFEEALRRFVQPVSGTLTLSSMEVGWPDLPQIHNEEVHEFVGDEREIARFVRGAQAIVTHVAPVTEQVLAHAPDVRIIGCCRGGPVNINLRAASARGIPVVSAPGRNAQAVIEFTLGLILAECRGIGRAHSALSNGVWQGERYRYNATGRELRGQTIGLIGFGAIAQGLVPYLRVFQMRILTYDPYVPAARVHELGVESVSLAALLRQSDIVSVHARVTPETIGMLGVAEFAQMKPGAYFINTARGSLVDPNALYQALESGHLAGAGLDTFAYEPPPPDWSLLKLPNVTVTPHIAGASKESAERGAEAIAHDIANFVCGRSLVSCANAAMLGKNHHRLD